MFYVIRKRSGNSGMSLVELLVVMAILSVVMLAVMSLYIPAQRATTTQTQLSDVQSNMRLALRVMTRDLLTAGFLLPSNPIAFSDAAPSVSADILTDRGTKDFKEFYIRTRIVGDRFARIDEGSVNGSGFIVLKITEEDMIAADGVNRFPAGARVRIFDSVGATEIIPDAEDATPISAVQRAYRVDSSDSDPAVKTITIDTGALESGYRDNMASGFENMQAILVRVLDENQPPLQTIKYKLANGTLERYVNGDANKQILARGLDPADSSTFDFPETNGKINRVDITLVGKTAAGKAGTLSEEKTREIKTTVKIRNVQ